MSTKIEWCDETVNIVAGCEKASPGCANCYAERMAARLASMGKPGYVEGIIEDLPGSPRWSGKVVPIPGAVERLASKCAGWRKPRRVFVQSMGDLFHDQVPRELQRKVFATFHNYPQHVFQILTKRPENMRAFIQWYVDWVGFNAWPKEYQHVWLGVTAENQEQYDKRWPILRETPAAVRFVSYEPALGPLDIKTLPCRACNHPGDVLEWPCPHCRGNRFELPDWVICGGETGPGARKMNVKWAQDLRDQCNPAGVPFFFKKLGSWWGKDNEAPEHLGLNIREFPRAGA